MDLKDRKWQLLARSLNREASSSEQEELAVLLNSDPALQQQFEILNRLWQDRSLTTTDDQEIQQAVEKIFRRADLSVGPPSLPPARRRHLFLYAAAAVILLLVSGFIFWREPVRTATASKTSDKGSGLESMVVRNGSRSRFLLADGTIVWLNGGSKLVCDNDFNGATREVHLDGEAYFQVTKKDDQPFIVHTGGIDIQVLGTIFNVKAYPDDRTIETTLFQGAVRVIRSVSTGDDTSILLRPNEKLILHRNEASAAAKDISAGLPYPLFEIEIIDTTKAVNDRFETAWVYSRLEFRGDSFEELARKLERWYNVRIVFTDSTVKKLRFNGSFKQESVEQAFTALNMANPFTYNINKNEISIGPPE